MLMSQIIKVDEADYASFFRAPGAVIRALTLSSRMSDRASCYILKSGKLGSYLVNVAIFI